MRQRVAGTWAFRTRAEIEAAKRFDRMADELEQLGAERVVVQGAREAAEDERRHRDICAEVARRWGVEHPTAHVAPKTRIGRSDMDPRDRLLWEVVSVCCLGETMNSALLTRSLEVVKDPEIRVSIRELLKDEVRHSRVGWAHLAAERAAGRGAFLRDVLPIMLEASVEPGFLDGTAEAPWSDEMYDYGELPLDELVQLYRDAMEQLVFKGLDAVGVDTSKGRSWLSEQGAPSTGD